MSLKTLPVTQTSQVVERLKQLHQLSWCNLALLGGLLAAIFLWPHQLPQSGLCSWLFIVCALMFGDSIGWLVMVPLVTIAIIRKTKSVVSPPSSLLPGPIAKSHSFSVFSPRVPAPTTSQNQSSAPKFSDLVLGDQAFQGRAVSRYNKNWFCFPVSPFHRQELLKSLTSSSDEASPALTLLQPRPESTPPG